MDNRTTSDGDSAGAVPANTKSAARNLKAAKPQVPAPASAAAPAAAAARRPRRRKGQGRTAEVEGIS